MLKWGRARQGSRIIPRRLQYVPGCRRSASGTGIGLATDVWVLVLIPEVESEVIDNVASIFDDIGTFLEVLGSGITADVFESGQVVGVGSGGKARQDALLGKEERTGANRHDGSLTSRVPLLKLREIGDETERLSLLLQHLLGVAADDDKDIEVLEAFVGLLVGDLGADDGTLLGENLGLGTNDGNFEGLGTCQEREMISGRGNLAGN